MNTNEAAKKVGVPLHLLLQWQREGWLTPASNGKDGQGRRLEWSESDVIQAKALMQQESHKSASEAIIDSLGGDQFLTNLRKARESQKKLLPHEVFVVGPRCARIFQRNSLLNSALEITGEPAILMGRASSL